MTKISFKNDGNAFYKTSLIEGISLIVLVITIIIVIILAGTIILSLSNNNPISFATEASFKTDVSNFNSELQIKLTDEYLNNGNKINARGSNINRYITSLNLNKYPNKFAIINNVLVYIGNVEREKKYCKDVLNYNEEELYVSEGMILHYDGKNNTGSGNSINTNIWKDLSGNNNDGKLNQFDFNNNTSYWKKDGLRFFNSNVSIKQMNYEYITMEIVAEYESFKYETTLIANYEEGGYGIQHRKLDNKQYFNYCSSNGYIKLQMPDLLVLNKKYSFSGSLSEDYATFSSNGNIVKELVKRPIKYPLNNTIMALGGNPHQDIVDSEFIGTIYSVRIYNRALTNEEIQNNYNIDKMRFDI
ncbi:MAG: LamG-like jellyroll fold domain-containing protein [Clostridia bacterium]